MADQLQLMTNSAHVLRRGIETYECRRFYFNKQETGRYPQVIHNVYSSSLYTG
jgi:hypothetical protein